jgi:hypothetical protein
MQDLDHGEGSLRDPFVFAVQVRRYVCRRRLAAQGAGSGCIHGGYCMGGFVRARLALVAPRPFGKSGVVTDLC